ncbi:MAG: class I SAM-dependent methyltransferase [Gemmatimonadaceae bacterium]|nr:class I SAM-dependent methyltransferase [Gemmatimonadaceae bacterium]
MAISIRLTFSRAVDLLGAPLTIMASAWLSAVRRLGGKDTPISRRIFAAVGVFPIRRHYYEPFFDPRDLVHDLSQDRILPGIDMNVAGQLALLGSFHPHHELLEIPETPVPKPGYYYGNDSFVAGDAEYLYHVIRHFKPKRFIEIGSGMSTLLVRQAIADEQAIDSAYACEHTCIEPYESPWLSLIDVNLIRQRVEQVELETFASLDAGDVLFIDSSHVVRPQGDVVFEYLEILPRLRPGVLVHVHDIFTPRDYPAAWVHERMYLWTEQYLVEAFLTCNPHFEIIGALNFLVRHHRAALHTVCPVLARRPTSEDPGSLWLRVRNTSR